ncbi:hypothetical protein [Scytonema millei]|uniref:hypothetical protein n=1 Tax=Scytonema millei TaxID=1245922 RepID=UPI00398C025A
MTEQRQDLYINLIEQLLNCPNGQEPEILDAQPDLLDADLVKTMMQVATVMAHQDNQDAAKFLIHIARQLAKQLELYPQLQPTTNNQKGV